MRDGKGKKENKGKKIMLSLIYGDFGSSFWNCVFWKMEFSKVRYEIGFFEKVECLVKVFFEKVECLANTYKSGSLSYKLPKNDKIYIRLNCKIHP